MRLPCAVSDPVQRGRARFKNLDKLVHHANLDGRVNVFYSSPAAYTAAKHAYNLSWPLKTDDFFPYADCPTCYWTGARAPAPRAQPAARAPDAAPPSCECVGRESGHRVACSRLELVSASALKRPRGFSTVCYACMHICEMFSVK